jgi:hypothetical protein
LPYQANSQNAGSHKCENNQLSLAGSHKLVKTNKNIQIAKSKILKYFLNDNLFLHFHTSTVSSLSKAPMDI